MKKNIEEAKKHLEKLREIVAKNPTPIFKMSKENVIKTLRKTRETLWEERIANCSGLKVRRLKIMRNKKVEAKKLLKELRESINRRLSPFKGMTEEQVITELRKTRERLWEEKLADSARRK